MPTLSTLVGQARKYVAVGLTSLSADFSVTMITTYLILGGGLSLEARLLGFAAGAAISFHLNRKFTFMTSKRRWQVARFIAVVMVAGSIATLIYNWIASAEGIHGTVFGWLASVGFAVPFQFVLFRFWVFRD